LVWLFTFFPVSLASFSGGITSAEAQNDVPESIQVLIADFEEDELRGRMEQHASTFLNEINRALQTGEIPDFGDELHDSFTLSSFTRLWNASPFYVDDELIIEQIAQRSSGDFEMRNITLQMRSEQGEFSTAQAVLQFSPDGKLSEFRLALDSHRYQNIMRDSQDEVDEENRLMIISFLEIFRTAYNQKDIDFIEQVFSDEALIIVGKVVESAGEASPYEQQVEFLRFNKDEYISRLNRVFQANTWIDVGFEEVQIFRHRKHPHMYGISVVQYYDSSIYSDEGYLFLLIDFSTPEEPMIHVRTWQPRQATPDGAQIGIGDIEIL
jgi:hypothetical protein